MESNIRFRNHISIVAERMGSILVFFFFAFMGGLSQNIKTIAKKEIRLDASLAEALLPVLGILTVFLLIIVFEMLLGTCKVKLDTNSLSTADKTDVKIVLKKSEAEKFRRMIMTLLHQAETGETGKVPDPDASYASERTMQYDMEAGLGDMLIHGLFSVNIFSVLVLVGCIVGAAELFAQTFGAGMAGKSIIGVLGSVTVVIFFFFSALWDIVKGFLQYYDFKAKRLGNKIYLSYGLFKKVHYTIPVDKINAVKLTQSLQARAAGFLIVLEFRPGFFIRAAIAAAGITLLSLLTVICRFLTAGVSVEEEYLKLAHGYMRRSILCVSYDKIQHISVKQNVIAKKAEIQKGSVFLLASALNKTQSVPYFREGELSAVKDKMVKTSYVQ